MDTPPPPPPPPYSSPPPPPPPSGLPATPTPKKGNKALVIVLCIVGFLFLLIAGCVGACFYGVHKAKEYGESAQRNPQFAAASLIAAVNPDIQVVSKDEASGKITVRNKKTGEVVTIDTTAYSKENISKAMEDFAKGMKLPPPSKSNDSEETTPATDDAKPQASATSSSSNDRGGGNTVSPARAAALADVLKKFPNYVPTYPGGKTKEASLNSLAGYTTGTYAFQTTDRPESVVEFYENKISAGGFTVASKSSETNDYGPTSHLLATHSNPAGTFDVAAESQEHATHVVVSFKRRESN